MILAPTDFAGVCAVVWFVIVVAVVMFVEFQ